MIEFVDNCWSEEVELLLNRIVRNRKQHRYDPKPHCGQLFPKNDEERQQDHKVLLRIPRSHGEEDG